MNLYVVQSPLHQDSAGSASGCPFFQYDTPFKGGYIRSLGQGLYGILPLGLRVLRNIERIIREEMNALGGQEVSVPLVTPRESGERVVGTSGSIGIW